MKEYLLNGYAANQRFERIENDVNDLKKTDEFDFQIKTNLPPTNGTPSRRLPRQVNTDWEVASATDGYKKRILGDYGN